MTTNRSTDCPNCKCSITASEKLVGKLIACPKCSHRFSLRFGSTETLPANTSSAETNADRSLKHTSYDNSPATTLERLGRFELRSVLGQGAFGRVYQAYDPELDRLLALKVPIFGKDEIKKATRFQSEAKSAAKLRHPNIVPVFDSGCVQGQYYIATQYIDGETLAQKIQSDGEAGIDFRQAANWTKAIASALAYAHHKGVIHRDVKPHNVMLDSLNEPQLMDFGLAKRMNEDSTMTTEGALLGTPAYMAPEQAQGDGAKTGPHSDQYAIGAVLYELLTGKRPFEGPPHAVLAQILTAEPPAPSSLRPNVPCDLEAIALKAMSKEISHRYSNCEALAEDLDRWLKGEPTEARPITSWERLTRWSRRNRTLSVLSLGTVSAILIALFSVTLALLQTNAARKVASENLRKAEEQARLASEAESKAKATAQELTVALDEVNREKERAIAAEALAKTSAENAEKALKDLQAAQLETSKKEWEIEAQKKFASLEASRADALRERASRLEMTAISSRYQQRLQSISDALDNRKITLAKSTFDEGNKVVKGGWEWNYLENLITPSVPIPLKAGDIAKVSQETVGKLLEGAFILKHVRDGSRLVILSTGQIGLFDTLNGKMIDNNFFYTNTMDSRRMRLSRVLDCVQLEDSLLFLFMSDDSAWLLEVKYTNDILEVVMSNWVGNRSESVVDKRFGNRIEEVRTDRGQYLNCGVLTSTDARGIGMAVIDSTSFRYQRTQDRIEISKNPSHSHTIVADTIAKSPGLLSVINIGRADRGGGMLTVDAEKQFQLKTSKLNSVLRNGLVTPALFDSYPLEIQCGPWFNSKVPDLSVVSVTSNGTYLGTETGNLGLLSGSSTFITPFTPVVELGCKINCISFADDGTTLSMGLENGTVRLYETKGFSELEKISAHESPVISTSLSADGKSLASFSRTSKGSSAMLHAVGGGSKVWGNYAGKKLKGANITQARFIDSQAGKFVAMITANGQLLVDEYSDGKVSRRTVSRAETIAPTLSEDGKFFVGFDPVKKSLVLIDLVDAEKPKINSLGLSHWGPSFESINETERREWIRKTRFFIDSKKRILFGVAPRIYVLEAYDFSGRFLFAVASEDFKEGKSSFLSQKQEKIVTHTSIIEAKGAGAVSVLHGVESSPVLLRDNLLISVNDDLMYANNLARKQSQSPSFVGHTGAVTQVITTSDGERIFSASADRTVRIWDTQTNQQLLKLYNSDQSIADLDLSGDDRFLLIAKTSGEAIVLDATPQP
jgi:serine/threonine protein kinase/WD40 repeat protein